MTENCDLKKVKPLKTQVQIASRVAELGRDLTKKFKDKNPVVVGVLSGSFVFYADLIRQIDTDIHCEFLAVSSYRDQKVSSGEVTLTLDLSEPIEGRHVIVVEDLVDTGLTMNYLIRLIKARNPASLTTVCLLSKPEARKVQCQIDFVGFEVPNEFIVGYGIDCAGLYRNVPFLGVLKE